jgi:hypothetical protein
VAAPPKKGITIMIMPRMPRVGGAARVPRVPSATPRLAGPTAGLGGRFGAGGKPKPKAKAPTTSKRGGGNGKGKK